MNEINVIGLGYIGLPTALSMAANGLNIIGTDYNEELVNELSSGRITFEENGMADLMAKALEQGIRFTTEYQKAEYYIISVPTPYLKRDKKIDTCYLIDAIKSVLGECEKNAVLIIESTISPGTIDKYIRPLITQYGFIDKEDIHLVHAPERILPGNMLYELNHNPRTIGSDDFQIGKKVESIYQSFCQASIMITDIRTAEMSKVVENTYRDINIAFANELAKICRSDSLDIYEIIKIANQHPRVNILNPGPGVGGHCISVDPWFLVGDYPGLANIILAARKINDSMPEYVLERIHSIMKEKGLKEVQKVGFYGLTYKENVDDVRESPTLQLLECMERHLASGVKIYDPYVGKDIVDNQFHNLRDFLDSVDFVVIMVAHDEIKESLGLLKDKIVLDTRHIDESLGFYQL